MNVTMEKRFLRNSKIFKQTVATIGLNELSGAMCFIAIPLVMISISGSHVTASLAIFIYTLAAILSQIFSGGVVDKFDPIYTLRLSALFQSRLVYILYTIITSYKKYYFLYDSLGDCRYLY